jgi:cell division protein FtsL
LQNGLPANRKAETAGGRPRIVRICLLLLLIFLFEFFLRTWCGVQCIRTGYEITEARHRQEELLEIQKNLKIELARLTAPETLHRVAEQEFGLRTPDADQVVVLP